MLVEDGLISLDQPLSDIFPEFADMQVLVDPEGALDKVEPAKAPITIRQLQTHTAGLGYTIISKGPIQKAYLAAGLTPGRVSRNPIPGVDAGAPTPDIMTFMKRLAELPLVYQPGTQWSYSLSHDVLSAVIEKVSGKPLDQFLEERMFGPLGMKEIYYQVPADRADDLADNYAPFAGSLIPIDPGATSVFLDKPPFAFGSTGLVGTAGDYDKFLQMLLGFGQLGKVRVMKPDTVKLGMSNLRQYQGHLGGQSRLWCRRTFRTWHRSQSGGHVRLGRCSRDIGLRRYRARTTGRRLYPIYSVEQLSLPVGFSEICLCRSDGQCPGRRGQYQPLTPIA